MRFCRLAIATGKSCTEGFSRSVLCAKDNSIKCLRDCIKTCLEYAPIDPNQPILQITDVNVYDKLDEIKAQDRLLKQVGFREITNKSTTGCCEDKSDKQEITNQQTYQEYQEWMQRRAELIEQTPSLGQPMGLPMLHGGFCKWSTVPDRTKVCGTCQHPYIACTNREGLFSSQISEEAWLVRGKTHSFQPRLCGNTKCVKFEDRRDNNG